MAHLATEHGNHTLRFFRRLRCMIAGGLLCTLIALLYAGCTDDIVNPPDSDKIKCKLSPSSIDFGTVETGEYIDSAATITNTGEKTFICNFDVGSRHYEIFGTGGTDTLEAGDRIEIIVRFQPDTLGTVPCAIATGCDACKYIFCTGVGIELSLCDIEPSILDFGALVVGEHVDRSFVLRNSGDGVIRGSIGESSEHYSIVAGEGPYVLHADESVTVTVRYEPLEVGTHIVWIETGTATCVDVTCTGTGEYIWEKLDCGTAEDLHGVWGSSENDVVAVGTNGAIVRFNGTTWSRIGSGTSLPLYDVWGTASYDIFVVGASRTLLHHNGYSWGFMNNPAAGDILGVAGSAWNDVFAVGNGIIHYNGSEWNIFLETGWSLQDVYMLSENEAYAVDTRGTILHFNGMNWNPMDSGIYTPLNGIWVSSSNDIFVVGEEGNIFHYDGQMWRRMFTGLYSDLNAVWGTTPDDIYAAGQYFTVLYYDGNSWEMILHDGSWQDYFYDVWGSASGDVFFVGTGGAVYRHGRLHQ
jgi:hypothetical protein